MTQDGEMLGSVFRVFETYIFMTMIVEKLYTSNDGMSQTKKFSAFRVTRGKHGITQESIYIIHHYYCLYLVVLVLSPLHCRQWQTVPKCLRSWEVRKKTTL